MNIALPESMKRFVEDRVAEGGYRGASDYVCELIRADQRRKAEERLDALLLEGLESGAPIRVTAGYWEQKKRALLERHDPTAPPR
jgi:antitoxin ParD1/3/4